MGGQTFQEWLVSYLFLAPNEILQGAKLNDCRCHYLLLSTTPAPSTFINVIFFTGTNTHFC